MLNCMITNENAEGIENLRESGESFGDALNRLLGAAILVRQAEIEMLSRASLESEWGRVA